MAPVSQGRSCESWLWRNGADHMTFGYTSEDAGAASTPHGAAQSSSIPSDVVLSYAGLLSLLHGNLPS